ncbi:ATP-binding cassette subfamily B protein/ATP-binding cassette subfamily C protein [Nocardiopsis mwathae]|uniref:ATP-binding cassette subfamily B protein/ATP-binding cassette subfamily C protein n=1 Tax=Nocardiopsis mwathae TaxID=1472723 RepID=A0A7X0D3J9_9ACTN|nr:ABC transporter ATP-binding protein [Nocardiopsis mwathae]MBB6170283.1 ATP-binding cassette subfamily B protein/ATP-binding cassette subfamily C protein [Nocardiopsis mwathae]
MPLWRRRPPAADAQQSATEQSATEPSGAESSGARLPEAKASRYSPWAHELEATSIWRVAARLPALVVTALRWSWRASPRDTAATVGLNVAAGVFTAFGLIAVAGVLESLFGSGPTPERVRAALPSLLLVAGAAVARGTLATLAGWAQARLAPQVERSVELELFRLTSRIRLESFDDSDFADTMYRARDRGTREVARMVNYTVDVLTALIGLIAVAGVLSVLHIALLPLLILTVLPDGWAAVRAARIRYAKLREMTTIRRRETIIGDLLADRASAAELRAYDMRPFLLDHYKACADHVRDALLGVARRQTLVRAGGDSASGAATALTYTALGGLLVGGAMPLSVAGTAVLAIRQGQTSLNQLLLSVNACYESGLFFNDFLEFCDQARTRLAPPATRPLPGELEVLSTRGLVFAYPGTDEPALRGVDIEVRRGEVVALVGENGSGKSTLARLLSGLYTPQAGAVLWNGVDLAEVVPEEYRARIGLISQDYTQWPLSARRNITMERDTDEQRLRRALKLSGADEVVAELSQGLDTLLDKRFVDGADLSGGQKQRIAAARGLYRDADLVVADEPTAALDARAEQRLFDTLHTAATDRTVLLITHRLASVRMADRIYVLDRGRVVEQGTHEQLMDIPGGHYRQLFSIQADAYAGLGFPSRSGEE